MRPIPNALLTLAMSTLAAGSSAAAQPSWRAHLDPARARSAVDSYVVMVGERELGWQTLGWMREMEAGPSRGTLWRDATPRAGWLFADEIAVQGIRQRSEVRLDDTFTELGLRQEGTFGATPMRIRLDREGESFVGTALTPSSGPTAATVRAAVPADAIDDNALTPLLPLIAWQSGLRIAIPVVSSGKGTLTTYTATVMEARRISVRAGTFDVWHVAITGGSATLDVDITRVPPYRIVRFGPTGAPMSSQLAR